jgi:3-hydroxyisobutyrate dehydrogenase-like beta-hydroxyacid dehydrogenase
MALAMKTGVDIDLLIKAVASGSGGSMQFGIRAPWMAQRRFLPAQGHTYGLSHYFDLIGGFADRMGVATPLFDRAIEVHQRVIDEGFGEYDHAVLVDVIGAMPRKPAGKKKLKAEAKKAKKKIAKKKTAKKKKSKPRRKK